MHSMTVPQVQQSRDNPDPKNILADDQKCKQQVSDHPQGINQYYHTVEATAKPHQAQG